MARDWDDDRFLPKLGKPRARGGKAAKRFLNRALNAAARAGPGFSVRHGRIVTGRMNGRFGRGAGAARSMQGRGGALRRVRRVVIKTRIVKLAGKGSGAARAHLKYIQRDGVTREGEPGRLYDAVGDEADGKAFNERGEGDRHQFRFIVSAEDSDQLQDLKAFTRDLMAQMEEDLGTRLDWVAVDHFNTGHPHTHIVLRGVDDQGKDLVIARDYIAHGMRQRASELVTLELGPRTDHEIQEKLRREVDQDRFTSLDRDIVRDADGGALDLRQKPAHPYARFKHSPRMGRLRKLERMDLARETAPGVWAIAGDLEDRLRRIGERDDIIKTLHREMTRGGLDRSAADYTIFDPGGAGGEKLVGRIVAVGLSDELKDRHYVIVDGLDARTYYVDIGQRRDTDDLPVGGIVQIAAQSGEPREADRTIDAIAKKNDSRYSIDAHLASEPGESEAYARAHVRRLELLRRARVVERHADGSLEIPSDFLDRAAAFERAQQARTPVRMALLSSFPLERQVGADGATWLDHQLVGRDRTAVRSGGFGREVEKALDRRRDHLIEQGLAEKRGARIMFQRNLLETLRRREFVRVGARLADEMGIAFRETRDGQRVEGVYRRALNLASGRYALIEKSREFTLVPWRPVLERSRDKPVSGIVRGQSISWTLGRDRGPTIT